MSIAGAKSSGTAVAQVDAFTDEPYTGNPAGVCILDRSRDDVWMSRVAREMACANTAFMQRRPDGDGLDLRWFTGGGIEVDLCGHATLATAHVLYERKLLYEDQPARFHTRSGVLTAWRRAGGGIEMDFPLEIASTCEPPPALLRGLGAEPVWVGRNRLDYVVEVASEDVRRSLKPDLSTLAPIETRGFVVTARAAPPRGSRYDYALRFFGPRVGIPEDMVTGTAHCALAPYWRDKFADGRPQDASRQLLVCQRTMLSNAIRGHMAEFGYYLRKGHHNGTAELLKIIADERDDRIPAAARFSLDVAPLIQESRRARADSDHMDA